MNQDSAFADLFRRYATASLGQEPERLAAFYDQSFLAAGPLGAAAFTNDDDFLNWLKQVREFNLKAGMTSLGVVATRDISISKEYVLITVRWDARFLQTGDEQIEFEISYILRLAADGPRIAAYISHEDQEAVMRSRGLI
jgi:hypothetical protein